MNDRIIIKLKENTDISYDSIVELLHKSFQERLEQGLVFTSSKINSEEFKKKYEDGVIIVAIDIETYALVGVYTVHINRDEKRNEIYGYLEHLAIDPIIKRSGLGTRMLNYLADVVKAEGGNYLLSDTAVDAVSSVKWHKKNGFVRIGMLSYPSTDYFSYLYRKQISHPSVWDYGIFVHIVFIISYIKTILMRKEDGNPTRLYSFIYRFLHSN